MRGYSIPLGSRILAIPDAYDHAVFDEGSSPEAALDRIIDDAGSLFDSQFVDEFVKFMDHRECKQVSVASSSQTF